MGFRKKKKKNRPRREGRPRPNAVGEKKIAWKNFASNTRQEGEVGHQCAELRKKEPKKNKTQNGSSQKKKNSTFWAGE